MSNKRKSSSQPSIDTNIKLNQNLKEKLINHIQSDSKQFNSSENEYLLNELEKLQFNYKRSKDRSTSNIYSEITIFKIEEIVNVLVLLKSYCLVNDPGENLISKINESKKKVIENLVMLTSKFEFYENVEQDIESNYYYVNNEPVNNEPVNNEPVNDESINNEPINVESINNESINNESIKNEPVNDESINNEPVNVEPIDIFSVVSKYLSIKDLFTCRLVSKKLKESSDNTNSIDKLIIGQPGPYRINFWFYNNTKIKDENIISLKCFKKIKSLSIFNLNKNLKYLKIYDPQFKIEELSSLINLEALEFNDYFNYNHDERIINLNNLKFLVLNQFVRLNTPKLQKIQFPFMNHIKSISNPESIKHLIAHEYEDEFKILKNLEIIELRDSLSETINENLLIIFKNLKQLKINLLFHSINYTNQIIKNSLIKILNDKIKLKRKIDIYLEGIKIENINKFNELINIDINSHWKFQMDNYNLLDLNLPFIEYLRYRELEQCFNNIINDLPSSFFDKFSGIKRIIINDNVNDVNGLKYFLSKLNYLKRLDIDGKVSIRQSFYNNLPTTIEYLLICDRRKEIKFEFILRLSNLIWFSTRIDRDLFDLAFASFLNLKYLNYFRFYFNNKPIIIKKNGEFYYLNEFGIKLNFNHLVEESNKIRSKINHFN